MFDHVAIRASDGEASKRFYATVLGPLGVAQHEGDGWTAWGEHELFVFEDPARTRRFHIAFTARTREQVDDFWRVGTGAGYGSDGKPGPRPHYSASYYGSFLLDPDGNSAEAVHHDAVETRGLVDHMWIRVADLAASKRFYEVLRAQLGLRLRERPGRFHVAADSGTFALVQGDEATENVHIAFPASDDAAVAEFHRTLTGAGYRDNGPPGERDYHAGYYAAFVLDPDGNNIEVVNHNRG